MKKLLEEAKDMLRDYWAVQEYRGDGDFSYCIPKIKSLVNRIETKLKEDTYDTAT